MLIRQISLQWISLGLAGVALVLSTGGWACSNADTSFQGTGQIEAESHALLDDFDDPEADPPPRAGAPDPRLSGWPGGPEEAGQREGSGAPLSPDLLPFDVRNFGAQCDGVHSDGPAINRAIQAAGKSENRTVYIPAGTCYVRQEPGQATRDVPIRPEVNGLILSGEPGGASRILLDADSPAILVSKGNTSPPEEVKDLTLQDLTIEVINGRGVSNTAVVQLNHATNLHVADIAVKSNGLAHHARGILMSGVATSQGSTGLIERVVVDGGSKPGIYVASGTHHLTVKDCETMNMGSSASLGPPAVGMSISDAHSIRVIDHQSHHNGGDGLLIATNGLPPIRLPGLPDDAYGSYYPLGQDHGPATTVEVNGGRFVNNGGQGGSGIKVASLFAEVPRDIRITGAIVQDNRSYGVLVEAGDSIVLEGAVISDNGIHGVLVRDVVLDGQAPEVSRTSRVQVIDPHIYDNGLGVSTDIGGVEVWGRARHVSLLAGIIEKRGASSRQNVGIGLVKDGGRSCLDLLVEDIDVASAPMPYGWRSSEGVFNPVAVPSGRLFNCDGQTEETSSRLPITGAVPLSRAPATGAHGPDR